MKTAIAFEMRFILSYVSTSMVTAKVLTNGRSQMIRLPKSFRVQSDKVYLKKVTGGFTVLLENPWESFETGVRKLSGDFAVRMGKQARPPTQKRDWRGIFK